MVGRRYRRLHEEKKPLPELVVIDGGRGQIGAALKAFLAIGVEPPTLIGLAKKHETIIFPDERAPLNLPLNHLGLNLLQRVRDGRDAHDVRPRGSRARTVPRVRRRRDLYLVRPDGHVGWRGDALPANCLEVIDTVRGAGPVVAARRGSTRPHEATKPTLVPNPQRILAA